MTTSNIKTYEDGTTEASMHSISIVKTMALTTDKGNHFATCRIEDYLGNQVMTFYDTTEEINAHIRALRRAAYALAKLESASNWKHYQ